MAAANDPINYCQSLTLTCDDESPQKAALMQSSSNDYFQFETTSLAGDKGFGEISSSANTRITPSNMFDTQMLS